MQFYAGRDLLEDGMRFGQELGLTWPTVGIIVILCYNDPFEIACLEA